MKICIVGCGNMGLAFARSFLKYGLSSREELVLVEKDPTRQKLLSSYQVGQVCLASDPLVAEAEVIMLAVKPQDFQQAAAELKPFVQYEQVVLSIMAGIKIDAISHALGLSEVVRSMPNAPAELGLGMTGFSASSQINFEQLRKVENLLNCTGRTVYFPDENMLDAVTAISGSGPAYFYYFVQAMVNAAEQMGIDHSTAVLLTKQTMVGAYHLLNQGAKSPEELIKAVASKGGTTEAALKVFNAQGVENAIIEALMAAKNRATELADNKKH